MENVDEYFHVFVNFAITRKRTKKERKQGRMLALENSCVLAAEEETTKKDDHALSQSTFRNCQLFFFFFYFVSRFLGIVYLRKRIGEGSISHVTNLINNNSSSCTAAVATVGFKQKETKIHCCCFYLFPF